MKRVLCYGDSNTWGDTPKQPNVRYSAQVRWPGRLQIYAGPLLQIIEEGLNGRTTGLEDPNQAGRNGLTYLGPCLESQNPLDLVILMLGINDLNKKYINTFSPTELEVRVRALIKLTKTLGKTASGQVPEILLVAPQLPRVASIFYDAFVYPELEERARLWESIYYKLALQEKIHFVDLGSQVVSSPLDGIHLDPDQHEKIAQMIYHQVSGIFSLPDLPLT